jgi:hypothetical protein
MPLLLAAILTGRLQIEMLQQGIVIAYQIPHFIFISAESTPGIKITL